MNILAIGNSFSQDATRYLKGVAKADDCNITVVNLFIGGCPLSTHYKNILEDYKAYSMEFNGEPTGFFVSIKDALLSRRWDYVTMQQVSNESPDYETYQPYLNELSAYVKKYAPKAKQLMHMTWAYEEGSDKLCKDLGYEKRSEMFAGIKKSYTAAAEEIGADGIIPSGELLEVLTANGIEKVHRDTFHATYGLGRYALALLWYSYLTGNDVENNTFADFDEAISEKEIKIAKECVKKVLGKK